MNQTNTESSPNPSPAPDFCSLTEIMERFSKVPFDQFQKELNEWFLTRYSERPPTQFDLGQIDSFPEKLIEVANQIFKQV